MANPGMNLLPEELREAEDRELKKPVPPPRRPGYSAPASQFEERLREVSSPVQSPWGKLKSWFSTVPPPGEDAGTPPAPSTPLPAPAKRVASGPPPISSRPVRAENTTPSVPLPPGVSPRPAVPPPAPTQVPKAPVKPPPPIPLGMLLDVNLLPGDTRSAAGGERPGIILAAIAGGAVLLVGIAYAVLSSLVVSRQTELTRVEDAVTQFNKEVASSRQLIDSAELAGRKMDSLSDVLVGRPDWSKFFVRFEELTLGSVTYSTMTVTGNGELTLGAEAPSVTDLARQLMVLERATDVVSKVAMGSITVAEPQADRAGSARTTFQVQLVPDWLNTTSQSQP